MGFEKKYKIEQIKKRLFQVLEYYLFLFFLLLLMKNVVIKFNSILELKYFNEAAKLKVHDFNIEDKFIDCECSEAEIELAVNGFGALIIDKEEIINND